MALSLSGSGIVSANIQAGAILQANLSSTTASGGPAFSAYLSSNQTITNTTYTKVTINSENFDTASCFDTASARFTPNAAGYYLANFTARLNGSASPQIYVWQLRKNGVAVYELNVNTNIPTYDARSLIGLISMNGTTDYLEAWVYFNTGGTNTVLGTTGDTYFEAYLAKGF
jgi:hypothetical protein